MFALSWAVLAYGLAQPRAGVRFAAAALRSLNASYGSGAVIELNGRRLIAACRHAGNTMLVSLSDGSRFRITGTSIHPDTPSPSRAARWRQLFAAHTPALLAAEAELAGSHQLYARQLAHDLNTASIPARQLTYAGHRAYALRLHKRPRTLLIIDQQTFRPLAVSFHTHSLTASSRLLPLHAGQRAGC